MAREMPVGAGFEVLEAVDGRQAVTLFRERAPEITAVPLDITMPEMDGREALVEIREVSETVPVVVMSGYTDDVPPDPTSGAPLTFLKKPFRSSSLAQKLGEAMAPEPPVSRA